MKITSPGVITFLFAVLTILGLVLLGCNSTKKLESFNKSVNTAVDDYISNHPPRIDTFTKTIPGKIIEVPLAVRDTAEINRILDSLKNGNDCSDLINDAFNSGMDYQRERTPKQIICPPSKEKIVVNTDVENTLRRQRDVLTGKNGQLETDKTDLENQLSEKDKTISKWKWKFYGAISLSLIVGLLLLYFKFKKRARQSITKKVI